MMVERLGRVLYWAGCMVASVLVGIALLMIIFEVGNWFLSSEWKGPDKIVEFVPGAFIWATLLWGIGRAARYILANE